jgi:hypothetical protein
VPASSVPGAKPFLFLETQIGSPGGSCNPSSMRKAYLRTDRFGSLLDTYPLLANIGRTENFIDRFGDLADGGHPAGADSTLRLLDEAYLYDTRPIRIISVAPQTVHAASRNVDATHVVAEFSGGSANAKQRMRRVELWHHATFPFGVGATTPRSPGSSRSPRTSTRSADNSNRCSHSLPMSIGSEGS